MKSNPIPRTTKVESPNSRKMPSRAQDVTGHRQTKEALRKSEEQYRLLFNSMTEGFAFHELIFDENGEPCDYRFLDINRAFEQITGLKREDIIGRGQREVLPEEDLFWFRTYCEVALNGRDIHLEHYSPPLQRHFEVYAYCPAPNQFAVIFTDITERKKTEEALRESEGHYLSLFDRVMDGVYRSTHEGRFLDVNLAMVRMFGYSSREEMLKVDIKKELYFAPDERGSHILDTGREEMDVYRMRRKDGSEIWVEDHGSYVHDEQGKITYHEGMLRDITERKQAETLREVLLEIMQGGVTSKELQDFLSLVHRSIDKVIYAENFFVVLYNKDADWFEEIYSVDKFDPPGLPSRDKKSISAYVIRTGRPLLLNDEQVFSQLVAQGEVELVGTNSPSWMGVPLKTSKETIGVMVVQDYDVPNRYSERDLEVLASIALQVALVVERKRAEEALAASEAELRALFASMHDAVLVIDRDGVYRKIAPTNPGLLVKPPEELLGKNLTDVFPPEDAETFREVVLHVLDTKKSTQIEYELFIGGRTVWFQTTMSALNADSTLWVAHDITNRKQAEEELASAKDELETANLELQQSLEREKLLSCTDSLTDLYNRRHLFELADREFHAAARYQRPLAFLMFDVDGFKEVNDTHGHSTGDRLLVLVAQNTVAQVRGSDMVARYGGDEFIVILPHTNAQQALIVAERIRASVEAIHMETDKGSLGVTLSIGIAETRHELEDENVERVIQRADQAMYKAKQGGRNRVVIFGQDNKTG